MGACQGTELEPQEQDAMKASTHIDNMINTDFQDDSKVIKLLLLGTGESGKSTLFKQMIHIYTEGFTQEDRKEFIPIVYSNVRNSMQILCAQSEELSHEFDTKVDEKNKEAFDFFIEDLKNKEEGKTREPSLDAKVCKYIKQLWADPGIKETYNRRSLFQLNDSCKYFFKHVDRLNEPNYLPNKEDLVRARARTTGIIEKFLKIQDHNFKIVDVGGQRSERKKWIHCFEDVTSVVFVVAINEYDQTLFEDEETNRIIESLNLFEEISNSEWFRNTSVMLFFNKSDLFREKLEHVKIGQYFDQYDPEELEGENDFDKGTAFFEELFVTKCQVDKSIYVHVTCAIDDDNVETVFNMVKDVIVRKSLHDSGLYVVSH